MTGDHARPVADHSLNVGEEHGARRVGAHLDSRPLPLATQFLCCYGAKN